MDLFHAIILGIIQGFTAWIPVSSKTQVIIFGALLYKLPFQQLLSFALIVHVGDVLASLWLFRKEINSIVRVRPGLNDLSKYDSLDENKKLAYFLAISLFFSALVGIPVYLCLRHSLSELAATPLLAVAGCLLILMGVVMFFSKYDTGNGKAGARAAIIAGMAQGLAVLPGISRSGITESALLLQNIDQERAVRLSFLMGLPMIAGAIVLFNFTDGYGSLDLPVAIAGIFSSTITAYLTLSFLLRLAKTIKFHWFAIILGLIAIIPFVLATFFGIGV